MVGGHQRHASPDQPHAVNPHNRVVIDMVQVPERQDAGVRAGALQVGSYVGADQMRAQKLGGEAAGPLVEVADDQAGVGEVRMMEQGGIHQFAALAAALQE